MSYQILTKHVQVLILCLSYFITTVTRAKYFWWSNLYCRTTNTNRKVTMYVLHTKYTYWQKAEMPFMGNDTTTRNFAIWIWSRSVKKGYFLPSFTQPWTQW